MRYSNPPSNVSLDNLRRTFDLSGMIQELRPVETPFFTYLTKVRKVPTTDPHLQDDGAAPPVAASELSR